MSTASAQAVPDTQLGLTSEEVLLLRQAQNQAAAAGSSSSRAASRASSQGLLLLDSGSLAVLGHHLARIMAHIQQQLEYLTEQANVVILQTQDDAGNMMDNADAELARFEAMQTQMDELEVDFDRIAHINEIVEGYKARAEELERELNRSQSSTSSRRDGHTSSRHGHGHSHSHGHSSHRHGHGASSGRHRH